MGWFHQFPLWQTVGLWVTILLGLVVELYGVFKHKLTYSATIWHYIPVWVRWIIIGLLIQHFGLHK